MIQEVSLIKIESSSLIICTHYKGKQNQVHNSSGLLPLFKQLVVVTKKSSLLTVSLKTLLQALLCSFKQQCSRTTNQPHLYQATILAYTHQQEQTNQYRCSSSQQSLNSRPPDIESIPHNFFCCLLPCRGVFLTEEFVVNKVSGVDNS